MENYAECAQLLYSSPSHLQPPLSPIKNGHKTEAAATPTYLWSDDSGLVRTS